MSTDVQALALRNAEEHMATSAAERRRGELQAELDRFVTIVVEQMQPERIVLFGSFAQGRVHEWSDLDIAVVAPTELPFYERLDRVFRNVQPRVGLDLLVYTPEEWDELRATRPFIQEEIVAKGRVLYERCR